MFEQNVMAIFFEPGQQTLLNISLTNESTDEKINYFCENN